MLSPFCLSQSACARANTKPPRVLTQPHRSRIRRGRLRDVRRLADNVLWLLDGLPVSGALLSGHRSVVPIGCYIACAAPRGAEAYAAQNEGSCAGAGAEGAEGRLGALTLCLGVVAVAQGLPRAFSTAAASSSLSYAWPTTPACPSRISSGATPPWRAPAPPAPRRQRLAVYALSALTAPRELLLIAALGRASAPVEDYICASAPVEARGGSPCADRLSQHRAVGNAALRAHVRRPCLCTSTSSPPGCSTTRR